MTVVCIENSMESTPEKTQHPTAGEYRFNAVLIRIAAGYFIDMYQLFCKYVGKDKSRMAKIFLKKNKLLEDVYIKYLILRLTIKLL